MVILGNYSGNSLLLFLLTTGYWLLTTDYWLLLDFLQLGKLQFHRGRTPEDADHHPHPAPVRPHLVHHPGEIGKGPVVDLHLVPGLELDLGFGPRPLRGWPPAPLCCPRSR